MLHGACADVLNALIKSATAAHVFRLIAPAGGGRAGGRVIIQSAASLVSHMLRCLQQALMRPDTTLEMQSGGKPPLPGGTGPGPAVWRRGRVWHPLAHWGNSVSQRERLRYGSHLNFNQADRRGKSFKLIQSTRMETSCSRARHGSVHIWPVKTNEPEADEGKRLKAMTHRCHGVSAVTSALEKPPNTHAHTRVCVNDPALASETSQ